MVIAAPGRAAGHRNPRGAIEALEQPGAAVVVEGAVVSRVGVRPVREGDDLRCGRHGQGGRCAASGGLEHKVPAGVVHDDPLAADRRRHRQNAAGEAPGAYNDQVLVVQDWRCRYCDVQQADRLIVRREHCGVLSTEC